MATLNLTKLAIASIILNGVKVNVKKILKTKEEVIMENGERLPLMNIRAVGRGFVYDAPVKASAKASAKAPVKPAAAPVAKAPAMGAAMGRGAPVTADELSIPGKHVTTKDGERLAVDTVLPKKGIVKLAGNVRIEIANIIRRGKGLFEVDVTDVAPANTKPAARSETKPASPKAIVTTPGHMAIEIKTLRGAMVKVGGRFEKVEKLFASKGQVMTEKGTRLDVHNIHQKGTKYIYTVPEVVAPVVKPAAKAPAKTEVAPVAKGGIRRREEPVDVKAPVGKTKTSANVLPFEKPVKVKKIEAMTTDLSEEVRTLAEHSIRHAIAKHFDLKFVASAAVFNNEVVTIEATFALGSYTPKQIAALLAEMKSEEDDSEEFDQSELVPANIVEEEDEDDSEEDEDDSEEDEDDSEEDEDDSEEDDSEEDDSEEDDSEEDDSEEDDEFENEEDDSEEEEDDDIDAKVDAGVAALEKKFGAHASFKGYVENYLLSEEVEKSFGDDMTVGVTKLDTDKGVYVLVGLHEDGNVILINAKTQKLRKCTVVAVSRMEEA